MKKIISYLESNIFNGITIKKGLSRLTNAQYEKVIKSAVFLSFVKQKLIILPDSEGTTAIKSDFEKMDYSELKDYVINNNIQVKSMKKKDLLEALKGD